MSGAARISRRALALLGLGVAGAAALPANARARRANTLSLEDRAGIEDLFTRYLWAYDCSDEAACLTLFTPDAIIVGKGTAYRDRAAILGWFRNLIAMREREGDDIWMHEAGQFRFIPAGPGCIAYAYATHFSANTAKAVRGVRSLGYFTCECVPDGQEWKFRRFSISTWDRSMVPWKKPLPWASL